MATDEKIREKIRDIAGRRNNVAIDEIEWVVKQLGRHYPGVGWREATHGKLFRVGSRKFMVSEHNPGSSQVKACYVDEFVDAMTDLGWYEE